MARIPFQERAKARKINIVTEVNKLNNVAFNLIDKDGGKLFSYLKDKLGCLNHQEFFQLLMNQLDNLTYEEKYLEYCDFILIFADIVFKNQVSYISYSETVFKTIIESMIFILDKIGYEIEVYEEKFRVVHKDVLAEEVASKEAYKDIRWRILDYRAHKVTLDDKKFILMELYKKFEEIRKPLKNTSTELESKIGLFLNLIRHRKSEINEKNHHFYYDDEERWCDHVYNWLLEAFIHLENRTTLEGLED